MFDITHEMLLHAVHSLVTCDPFLSPEAEHNLMAGLRSVALPPYVRLVGEAKDSLSPNRWELFFFIC